MTAEHLMYFDRLPFLVGVASTPAHDEGIPNELPFELEYNQQLGMIRQKVRDDVLASLKKAYLKGSLLGTAMDDTALGRGYAEDFLSFVQEHVRPTSKSMSRPELLEIGAGRGYLLKLLQNLGWSAVGLEPSPLNAEHWKRFHVDVSCDFFPSLKVPGPFRVILAYAVLEHASDSVGMVRDMARQLTSDGVILLSVPHVGRDLQDGNISILLHEHFSYFTPQSLGAVLWAGGLEPVIMRHAGYGGGLYCAARLRVDAHNHSETTIALQDHHEQAELAYNFSRKANHLRTVLTRRLQTARKQGRSVGFFCAGRALNLLENRDGFRWFDDDQELEGHYYPPFLPVIESRASLLVKPVDELYVLSRTFGEKIRNELEKETSLSKCMIHIMDEILWK